MLRIDGTMIESKFSPGIIKTEKDPFLPMAVNVAGKDSKPEWHPVRIFAPAEQLENLRERIKAGGNLLVRGGVSVFKRLNLPWPEGRGFQPECRASLPTPPR